MDWYTHTNNRWVNVYIRRHITFCCKSCVHMATHKLHNVRIRTFSFNAESGVIDGPNTDDLGSNYVIRKVRKTDNTTWQLHWAGDARYIQEVWELPHPRRHFWACQTNCWARGHFMLQPHVFFTCEFSRTGLKWMPSGSLSSVPNNNTESWLHDSNWECMQLLYVGIAYIAYLEHPVGKPWTAQVSGRVLLDLFTLEQKWVKTQFRVNSFKLAN